MSYQWANDKVLDLLDARGGNNEVGSSCHSRRMAFEKNMNKAGQKID